MVKYHLNPTTGEPGKCSAAKGKCPFGSEASHFSSVSDARSAFESQQSSAILEPSSKKSEAVSFRDRRLWQTRSALSASNNHKDQLATPAPVKMADVDVVGIAAGITKPANWGEMGSSEKDRWEETHALSIARTISLQDWRSNLAEKAVTNSEWLKSLNNANLSRLATIVAGPASSHREKFDKDGTIQHWPDMNVASRKNQAEAAEKIRNEIGNRIQKTVTREK